MRVPESLAVASWASTRPSFNRRSAGWARRAVDTRGGGGDQRGQRDEHVGDGPHGAGLEGSLGKAEAPAEVPQDGGEQHGVDTELAFQIGVRSQLVRGVVGVMAEDLEHDVAEREATLLRRCRRRGRCRLANARRGCDHVVDQVAHRGEARGERAGRQPELRAQCGQYRREAMFVEAQLTFEVAVEDDVRGIVRDLSAEDAECVGTDHLFVHDNTLSLQPLLALEARIRSMSVLIAVIDSKFSGTI